MMCEDCIDQGKALVSLRACVTPTPTVQKSNIYSIETIMAWLKRSSK
jgi:hypothetical protein